MTISLCRICRKRFETPTNAKTCPTCKYAHKPIDPEEIEQKLKDYQADIDTTI